MGSDRPATRRRYSAAVKEQVLAECAVPGASVAKVAMAHGINANVLHRWRQLAREDRSPTIEPREAARQFVPVTIAAEPAYASGHSILINRGRHRSLVST
jgi:transposase